MQLNYWDRLDQTLINTIALWQALSRKVLDIRSWSVIRDLRDEESLAAVRISFLSAKRLRR